MFLFCILGPPGVLVTMIWWFQSSSSWLFKFFNKMILIYEKMNPSNNQYCTFHGHLYLSLLLAQQLHLLCPNTLRNINVRLVLQRLLNLNYSGIFIWNGFIWTFLTFVQDFRPEFELRLNKWSFPDHIFDLRFETLQTGICHDDWVRAEYQDVFTDRYFRHFLVTVSQSFTLIN